MKTFELYRWNTFNNRAFKFESEIATLISMLAVAFTRVQIVSSGLISKFFPYFRKVFCKISETSDPPNIFNESSSSKKFKSFITESFNSSEMFPICSDKLLATIFVTFCSECGTAFDEQS